LDKAIKYFNDTYLIDPYFVPKKIKIKEKGLKILKEIPVDEILKDIESKTQRINSYTASLIITTEIMGQEVITKGKITFKKPDKMKMEMTSSVFPQEANTTIISDGKTLWTHIPVMNMAQRIDLSRIKKEFSGEYEIEEVFQKHTKQSGDILNPLKGFSRDQIRFIGVEQTQMGEMYTFEARFPEEVLNARIEQWGFMPSKAKFWILKDKGIALKMDVYSQDGKRMLSQEYKDIELNPKISESEFVFTPPEGTQVIDMTDSSINMMKNMFKTTGSQKP
jgi:outer membrane lipoprotein-sorting protein